MSARTAAVALALVALAHPQRVCAYRTLRDDPELGATAPVVWSDPFVRVELASSTLSDARRSAVEDELRIALAGWTRLECASLVYEYDRSRPPSPASPGDARNTVQWVSAGWTARGFEAGVAATTDVQLARNGGGPWAIIEADVYVNADGIQWRPLSADPEAAHLAGALAHELAHVHGMSHPCEVGGRGGAPACSTSAEFLESVLYPIHVEGAHRPGPDDVAGTCALYPASRCGSCAVDEVCVDGGCEPAADHTHCPECSVCLEPADCGAEMTCRYGRCVEISELGQTCTRDVDCRSGACERGRCTRPCQDEPCPDGMSCDGDPPLCISSGGVDRSACETGDQCRSALCLEPSGGGGHCTNTCAGDASCLYGEACREVDGSTVCVPQTMSSGSCSASPGRRAYRCWLLFSLLLFAVLPFRRHRSSTPGRSQ